MSKKYPYGYDVDKYIDKAIEIMKETYPWAKREFFRKEYSFAIEKNGRSYDFVTYFKWSTGNIERNVIKGTGEDFIKEIISVEKSWIESANPTKDIFKIPIECETKVSGWYLECYEFRTHELGGYSSYVQAGDRTTGGSREFFLPPKIFKGTFSEFLDKYFDIVPPGSFGLSKDYLLEIDGLKEFLGFKK
jgi:hypothetical protein